LILGISGLIATAIQAGGVIDQCLSYVTLSSVSKEVADFADFPVVSVCSTQKVNCKRLVETLIMNASANEILCK